MGNKESLIVCTDDIRPGTVRELWSCWEKLKSDHPDLKLNAFVIPHYFRENSEYILNEEFVSWYKKVESWVQLHLHGFTHSFPPECLLSKPAQEELIECGARLLGMLCRNDFGFKAPGYHYNEDTIAILQRYHIKFLCREKDILWFQATSYNTQNAMLLQTHTNGISADSVEKIYDELNGLFKDKEFVFLNDLTK